MEGISVIRWVLVAICSLCIVGESEAGGNHHLLHQHLSHEYALHLPPYSGDESKPLTVKLDLTLHAIPRADPDTNTLDLAFWQVMRWNTPFSWSNTGNDFQNISQTTISAKEIWTPDVTAYFPVSAPERLIGDSADRVVLKKDGTAHYVPAFRIRTSCDLSTLDSDKGAVCYVKFGSWTLNGQDLDLAEDSDFNIGNYQNYKYEILNITSTRNVKHYSCCPEPYIDITFSLTIRKKGAGSGWGLF